MTFAPHRSLRVGPPAIAAGGLVLAFAGDRPRPRASRAAPLAGILANGHVLIEDYPGLAKTLD